MVGFDGWSSTAAGIERQQIYDIMIGIMLFIEEDSLAVVIMSGLRG